VCARAKAFLVACRAIALNRRNALFAGSDGSAEHRASIASLIDPLAYVTDVLIRIVTGHPNSDVDQLLPLHFFRRLVLAHLVALDPDWD
jgi:hypothetical protein